MRVIAGSARRLLLKTVPGMDTRPTTDRIKETLFNMLQTEIPGCYFLDLFPAAAPLALSRGADKAVFIENNPDAVNCIRENLASTRLEENALVMGNDVIAGLKRLEGHNYRFDVVFMDPPYHQGLEQKVLEYLAASPMVTEDTLIIMEAALDTDFDWLEQAGYHLLKNKEYKTNKHVFAGKGE